MRITHLVELYLIVNAKVDDQYWLRPSASHKLAPVGKVREAMLPTSTRVPHCLGLLQRIHLRLKALGLSNNMRNYS